MNRIAPWIDEPTCLECVVARRKLREAAAREATATLSENAARRLCDRAEAAEKRMRLLLAAVVVFLASVALLWRG